MPTPEPGRQVEQESIEAVDRAVQRWVNEDPRFPEDAGAVVVQWVVAVCVQVVDPVTGQVSTDYRRLQASNSTPPHHITGLLDEVSMRERED